MTWYKDKKQHLEKIKMIMARDPNYRLIKNDEYLKKTFEEAQQFLDTNGYSDNDIKIMFDKHYDEYAEFIKDKKKYPHYREYGTFQDGTPMAGWHQKVKKFLSAEKRKILDDKNYQPSPDLLDMLYGFALIDNYLYDYNFNNVKPKIKEKCDRYLKRVQEEKKIIPEYDDEIFKDHTYLKNWYARYGALASREKNKLLKNPDYKLNATKMYGIHTLALVDNIIYDEEHKKNIGKKLIKK